MVPDVGTIDAHICPRSHDHRATRPRGRTELGSQTVQETGGGTRLPYDEINSVGAQILPWEGEYGPNTNIPLAW